MVTEDYLVRKYLPVPYLNQGRTMAGFDCWGLILLIYNDLGYKLLDIDKDYDATSNWKEKHSFIINYHNKWDKVEVPKLFDVVLFVDSKSIHSGVILNHSKFIHCCKAGTVVSRLSEQKSVLKVEGFYHLKGR